MAEAIRGTSPTIKLMVPESINLREASKIYATFEQGKLHITKNSTDDGVYIVEQTNNVVAVPFTQEETLAFAEGVNVDIQLNWLTPLGERNATCVCSIRFGKQLLEEVI